MRRITAPTLSQLLRDAQIRYFSADELLYLGASHYAGRARNEAPPATLTCNLVAIARDADALRHEFGHPLLVLSAYRTQAYNAAVGGASRSWHLKAGALDLAPQDPNRIGDLLEVAIDRANRRAQVGGLGTYSTFVHLDIGPRRRW